MKCPACGTDDAYIGIANIDCLNTGCKYFQGNPTVATPALPPAPPAMPWGPSTPATSPTPSPVPWGAPQAPATTLAPVTVSITSAKQKLNSVEITFIAYGDPGNPTRQVEFFWSLPGTSKALCTLSNRSRYFVGGVDADGQTSYTTHWRCVSDGIQPSDPWSLEAVIQ